MTVNAFSVFNSAANVSPSGPLAIFSKASAKVPPSNSNTIDTVVEVGIPKVLKISNKTMSVIMTAKKMQISSSK